jgi:hypothetical protein
MEFNVCAGCFLLQLLCDNQAEFYAVWLIYNG